MWTAALAEIPPPARGAIVGAAGCGALGAVAGLIVGLLVNPGTAWFAVFELGVPAALLGAAIGLIVGTLVWLAQRKQRPTSSPNP